MKHEIRVLDHGYVRLIDAVGDDLSIVRAARTSHDADWRTGEDEGADAKLLRYLARHRHTSPFEFVTFIFEIKAPIFIFRQWHRHRTWSYNEVSARYSVLDEEFYVPAPGTIGVQSPSNKQARVIDQSLSVSSNTAHDNKTREMFREACSASYRRYIELLDRGVPRELARAVLPMSMYSRMFAKTDLHNLFHFIHLRDDEHAQWEIQQYAKALYECARIVAPIAAEALKGTKPK